MPWLRLQAVQARRGARRARGRRRHRARRRKPASHASRAISASARTSNPKAICARRSPNCARGSATIVVSPVYRFAGGRLRRAGFPQSRRRHRHRSRSARARRLAARARGSPRPPPRRAALFEPHARHRHRAVRRSRSSTGRAICGFRGRSSAGVRAASRSRDIAPDVRDPVSGSTLAEILGRLRPGRAARCASDRSRLAPELPPARLYGRHRKKSVDQFTVLRETDRGTAPRRATAGAQYMFNFLAATFGRPQTRPQPAADNTEHDERLRAARVRFRPRLTAQILRDHEVTRQQMRALLDACRAQDEDAADRLPAPLRRQLPAHRAQQERAALSVSALGARKGSHGDDPVQVDAPRARALGAADRSRADRLSRFAVGQLSAAALRARRRAHRRDCSRRSLRQEESTLLPLYMPPGQYRYVDGVSALTIGDRARIPPLPLAKVGSQSVSTALQGAETDSRRHSPGSRTCAVPNERQLSRRDAARRRRARSRRSRTAHRAAATAPRWRHRPACPCASAACARSSRAGRPRSCRASGQSTAPGATPLTRTSGARSRASAFVIIASAALLMQ